ncbi:MAG: hypothetical protein JWM05_1524 [Acidimicrobiales bacterium]|nr:hypothetical protein [Acidimicrobiales bacterium]
MHKHKPICAVFAAVFVAFAAIATTSSPSGATSSTCGTNSNSGPAQQIGEFPAIQTSQSALRFSCTFFNSATPALNELSTKFTLHDFQNAAYHPGAARQFTGSMAAGSKVLNAVGSHFTAADIGHTVSSVLPDGSVKLVGTGATAKPNIPARAFIAAFTNPTQVTLNIAAVTAVPAGTIVKLDNGRARSFVDATVTAGCVITSPTAFFSPADNGTSISGTAIPDYKTLTYNSVSQVTVTGASCTAGSNQTITIGALTPTTVTRQVGDATQTTSVITSVAAKFAASDVGLPVFGAGIPTGPTYITAVNPGANTATVTPAITANASPHSVVIGVPSVTAPVNGSAVAEIRTILDLNPVLVSGSNSCALNKPEGLSLQGTWNNPYNFQTVADDGVAIPFIGLPPASAKVIGQLVFRTSSVDFAGYIVESPAAGDALKPVPHFDIVFPSTPISSAACPAPNHVNVVSSFTINGIAQSQSRVPSGVGRPYSSQLRFLLPNPGAALVTTAVLKSDDTNAPKNWSFTGTCTMAVPPVPDFHCGD